MNKVTTFVIDTFIDDDLYLFSGDRTNNLARETRAISNKDYNVWANADRNITTETRDTKVKIGSYDGKDKAKFVAPTETLKEVIKHRPPVSEVVREITKESERDKLRQIEREKMQREAEVEFSRQNSGDFRKAKLKENIKGGDDDEEEDEAQKIYKEIIDVVASNSPASLQYVRGRMVGYGEEAQTTLRRGDRRSAALVSDREQSQHRVSR